MISFVGSNKFAEVLDLVFRNAWGLQEKSSHDHTISSIVIHRRVNVGPQFFHQTIDSIP